MNQEMPVEVAIGDDMSDFAPNDAWIADFRREMYLESEQAYKKSKELEANSAADRAALDRYVTGNVRSSASVNFDDETMSAFRKKRLAAQGIVGDQASRLGELSTFEDESYSSSGFGFDQNAGFEDEVVYQDGLNDQEYESYQNYLSSPYNAGEFYDNNQESADSGTDENFYSYESFSTGSVGSADSVREDEKDWLEGYRQWKRENRSEYGVDGRIPGDRGVNNQVIRTLPDEQEFATLRYTVQSRPVTGTAQQERRTSNYSQPISTSGSGSSLEALRLTSVDIARRLSNAAKAGILPRVKSNKSNTVLAAQLQRSQNVLGDDDQILTGSISKRVKTARTQTAPTQSTGMNSLAGSWRLVGIKDRSSCAIKLLPVGSQEQKLAVVGGACIDPIYGVSSWRQDKSGVLKLISASNETLASLKPIGEGHYRGLTVQGDVVHMVR